jgi:TolB-like protein/DNA-binding SARP family transcriptional activator/Flp pilus assembly protein TadD
MFYLRLFGTPALESDDTVITGPATQRHRLALLALLALAPGRRFSRDKLIAYLWPDRDTEGGRNLLRVATYVLRGLLGENALLSEGDDLRLNAEPIATDVAEFDVALERRDYPRAVALYQGPFLDGFFLSDAPEFESWSERERARLRGGFHAALEALAQAAADERDFEKAIEWWKLRAAQDPYDSRVALNLIECLEASGNRAGALQHASVHERMLNAEFNISMPQEIAAVVERLRSQPPVDKTTKPTAVMRTDIAAEQPAPMVVARSRSRRKWPAVVAVLAAVALTAAFLVARPRATDPQRSIVVLPFANLSPEQDVEYFSDGLTEEVISRLAIIPQFIVISRTSAMRYKDSKHSVPQIARELNVDHVLEGSVRHQHGRVRISAQLISARGDAHLWAQNYEYTLEESFRAQAEIAQDVARALSVELATRHRKVLAHHGTSDPDAYEFYRRGRMFWSLRTREGHELALQSYARALARDSNYAAAWAGLADAYHTAWQLHLSALSEDEAYSKAARAAERAFALNEMSSDAHTSLGTSQLWQHNIPGAARQFRRAIELDPSNAQARTWYTIMLRTMGRNAEASREAHRAVESDPFSAVALSNQGWLCYLDHDYDCAMSRFQKSLDMNAKWSNGLRSLGFAYALQGRHREAIATLHTVLEMHPHRPDFIADLAYVQALAGQPDSARLTLARAKVRPQAMNVARAHLALGEVDSAFVWLERAEWHWPARAILADPALDPIRADPRFAQLAARVERDLKLR